MPINLMNGLMAGANFGTGYFQGQNLANQLAYQNKVQNLRLDDAQLRLQQEQRDAKMQQDLSDRAMMRWQASDSSQSSPVPPATFPGDQISKLASPPGGSQVGYEAPTKVTPVADVDRMYSLARDAMSRGDIAHGTQLFTTATNMQDAQATRDRNASAAQLGELKRQQAHYEMAAQFASTLPDTPEGFNQWKMMVLADPMSSPQERQNVTNMQYRPGIMSIIRDSGMNASQSAAAKLRDQEFQERQKVDNLEEAHRVRRDEMTASHNKAMEESSRTNRKVGAVNKAPSSEEVRVATPIITQTLGLDPTSEILSSPDPNNPGKNTNMTPAVISIVSQAKQIMSGGNRAITFPQAVEMAAQSARDHGDFPTTSVPEHHFMGPDTTKTSTSYRSRGSSKDNPIDLSTVTNRSDLVKGKWYKKGNSVEQWNG